LALFSLILITEVKTSGGKMASIFAKKFDDIEYRDIQELVDNKVAENEMLDYKEKFEDLQKIANLISAFANTYGGFIIFGVREKKGTNFPELICGLVEEESVLEQKLTSCLIDKILPPVLVNSKFLGNDAGIKLLIVKVPESDLTPHAVDNNSTVYIRFRDQKRPIAYDEFRKADLGMVELLKNRRQRLINFRDESIQMVLNRLEVIRKSAPPNYYLDLVMAPKYPRNALVDFREIWSFVNDFLQGSEAPNLALKFIPHSAIHYNGGLLVPFSENWTQACFDFGCHGIFGFGIAINKRGEQHEYLRLTDLGIDLVLGLRTGYAFMVRAGVAGNIMIRCSIRGIMRSKLLPDWPFGTDGMNAPNKGCEIEDLKCHTIEYDSISSESLPQCFFTEFMSNLIYLYGVREKFEEISNHIYERAKAELSQINWNY
jgi:hypothetical protein